MSDSKSQRRLAENEVVFRQLNEKVRKGINETNRLALEDNQPEYLIKNKKDGLPLFFYCECSDENCTKRVKINLHNYEKHHQKNNQFVMLPGHEVLSIEQITNRYDPDYIVVEKFMEPPETASGLNPTAIKNV